MIEKLRELQEQASTGPWEWIGANDEEHAKVLEANDAFTAWVYDAKDEVATLDAGDIRENTVNAKLIAISLNHLLPLAEALEKCAKLLGGIAEGRRELHAVRHAEKALKNLQEALDG